MKKVFRIVFNRYVLTAAVFVVWMTFFDQNDWMTQRETRRQLQETKDNIKYLTAETDAMERDYQAMLTDPKRLERYAREHYRMKRDNEDIYIVEHK